MLENKLERMSAKNDFVFKRIFSKKGCEKFLKEFLSELLKIKITNIEILHDVVLDNSFRDEKSAVLDIKAIINDTIYVDVEMQRRDEKNIIKRSTYYASKMIAEQLRKKDNYSIIKSVVVIFLLDFNYFKHEDYITKSVIVADKYRQEEINNSMIYYYIELPKFRKSKVNLESKVEQWLTFLDGEKQSDLINVMRYNLLIKEADNELEYLNANENIREYINLNNKYLKEVEIAKYSEKIKIANNMLENNLSHDLISKFTGLNKVEIEQIK